MPGHFLPTFGREWRNSYHGSCLSLLLSSCSGYRDAFITTVHYLEIQILPEEDSRKKREKNAKKRDKHKARKKAKTPEE